eukprot:m.179030 g.179030  ORF g.179030 m.179030 type:complete len:592 (-) comp31954_c3_seq6:154-1929(-)
MDSEPVPHQKSKPSTVSPLAIWQALQRAQASSNGGDAHANASQVLPPNIPTFNGQGPPNRNGQMLHSGPGDNAQGGQPQYFHPVGAQQPQPFGRYAMPYAYNGFSNFNSVSNTPGNLTPIAALSGNATPCGHVTPTDVQTTAMDTAYAKLLGDHFAYYVQTMSVVLGRRTKGAADAKEVEGEPDVDLGPSKSISRRHATISYDTAAEAFFIQAHGKNGMQVDLIFYKCDCEPVQLYNGSRIQIANVGFWFFLPQGQLERNTQPLINAAQLHLRYLASRSPSPAPTITQPNSRVPSRGTSPIDEKHFTKKSKSTRVSVDSKSKFSRSSAPVRKTAAPTQTFSAATTTTTTVTSGYTPPVNAAASPKEKPTLTYAELIIEALEHNGGRLNLKAIYLAITAKYPYYRDLEDQDGWKNSIRHNLSLNTGFQKTKRLDHEPVVKGNYWVYVAPGVKPGATNASAPPPVSHSSRVPVKPVPAKKAGKRARRKSSGVSSSLRNVHSVVSRKIDEEQENVEVEDEELEENEEENEEEAADEEEAEDGGGEVENDMEMEEDGNNTNEEYEEEDEDAVEVDADVGGDDDVDVDDDAASDSE